MMGFYLDIIAEIKKILVIIIFYLSYNVFKSLLVQDQDHSYGTVLFGKGLTVSQTNPDFMCLQYKSFGNTVGKGEIACNKQFLLFPQCFLPVWRTL